MQPITDEDMGGLLLAAITHDAIDASHHSIGIYARYLAMRVAGDTIALDDIAGTLDDMDAVADLIYEKVLIVSLPAGDVDEGALVYLPTDPEAADIDVDGSIADAVAYLGDLY